MWGPYYHVRWRDIFCGTPLISSPGFGEWVDDWVSAVSPVPIPRKSWVAPSQPPLLDWSSLGSTEPQTIKFYQILMF